MAVWSDAHEELLVCLNEVIAKYSDCLRSLSKESSKAKSFLHVTANESSTSTTLKLNYLLL